MVQLVYQQHYSVLSCALSVTVNLLYLDEMFMAEEFCLLLFRLARPTCSI